MEFQIVPNGITAPKGFWASGVEADIKTKHKKDVALLFSQEEAQTAGVYTTNQVKAPPLLLTQKRVAQGTARALVVNSGNANVCNGPQGMKDALAMAEKAAQGLDLPAESVLVASTGVIGQPLPMEKILPGIEKAVKHLNPQGGDAAAEAIMTTDTKPKQYALSFSLGDAVITIGGMAKGSGMIHPNMATMLSFITTDAAVEKQFLQDCLRQAVEQTFNMISVDGDTSTNDMVLAFANGMAGNVVLQKATPGADVFQQAITQVCIWLAKAVAADGEGATKLIEVEVVNAATLKDARLVAKSVVSSTLLKAAIFGRDANWGRVLCAAGYSGAQFNPDVIDIYIGDEQVAQQGTALAFHEERALEILSQDTVKILLNLHGGTEHATAWGCDLTYEYVRINGEYRT